MSAPCPACAGDGAVWADDVLEVCDGCEGSGELLPVTLAPSPMAHEEVAPFDMAAIDSVPMPRGGVVLSTKKRLNRHFMPFDVASDDEGNDDG